MIVGKTVEEFENQGQKVVIRYPTMADAEDLMETMNSLVEEDALIGLTEKISYEDEMRKLSEDILEIEKGEKVNLLLEIDGKVLGYGSVSMTGEDRVSKFSIGLKSNARGRGLGYRMIETVLEEAEEKLDFELITLKVFENNGRAVELYEKMGFNVCGRIPDVRMHEGKLRDEIIMVRN